MRRFLTVAAVAATLILGGPAAAGYAATTPGVTRGNYIIGAGTLAEQFGSPTAYLGAYQTRTNPWGGFTVTYPDGTFAIGTITCLTVEGDVAFITGKIALSGGPRKDPNKWLRGHHLIIGVEDNGNGGAGEEPDKLNFSPGTPTDPGCGWNTTADPYLYIVKGNYRMMDAAA
jgi:hypothetical protein